MRNPSPRQTQSTGTFGLIHTRELIKEDIAEALEQYDREDLENLKNMLCKIVVDRFKEIK